jgi:hypothetical protein
LFVILSIYNMNFQIYTWYQGLPLWVKSLVFMLKMRKHSHRGDLRDRILFLTDGTRGPIQSDLTQYPEQRLLSCLRRCFLSGMPQWKQIFIISTL